MKFEQDEVRLLGGVRHGLTQGGPVAIEIANTEWPKWVDVMSADPVEDPALLERARNAPLTRPRPGHADLVGMQKYGFDDARPVLERASARETAARVALGEVASRFLEQAYGIRLVSHTVALGGASVADVARLPTPDDVEAIDADPVRTLDAAGSAAMVAEVEAAKKDGDTLGGALEGRRFKPVKPHILEHGVALAVAQPDARHPCSKGIQDGRPMRGGDLP